MNWMPKLGLSISGDMLIINLGFYVKSTLSEECSIVFVQEAKNGVIWSIFILNENYWLASCNP